MLAEQAELYGANIGIVTDFDASGVDIGAQLMKSEDYGSSEVKRLGIDIRSISECLDMGKAAGRVAVEVQVEELGESALTKNGTPSDNWTGLVNKIKSEGSDFAMYDYLHRKIVIIESDGQKATITYLEYLKNWRIELNTLVDVVGAEVFWNWLKKKTIEAFPNRNYNRAITIPAYLYTPTMLKFQEKLKEATKVIMANKVSELKETLGFTEGFKKTDEVSKQIKDILLKVVLKDRKIKRIDYALDELMDRLDR